jgi:hypothetical protein
MAPLKLWLCASALGCVLASASILSLRETAAGNAIIAIRVAHLELFTARIAFRDPAVHEAELDLADAWSALRERRYRRAVFAASAALQKVRGIKDEIPSVYSEREDDRRDRRQFAGIATRRREAD